MIAHLGDGRLYDCYLTESEGGPLDHLAADHLGGCAACAARYRELATFFDRLSADATAETDTIFTVDRLRAQQLQIARRLDLLGHPGRVIAFPGRAIGGSFTMAARIAPRWLAAAAAAGVIVGAAVGSVYDFAHGVAPASAVSEAPAGLGDADPAVALIAPVDFDLAPPSDDDAFFSLVEVALGGPRARELVPFDAMTPPVREASARLR
jgi:hypothetical protein